MARRLLALSALAAMMAAATALWLAVSRSADSTPSAASPQRGYEEPATERAANWMLAQPVPAEDSAASGRPAGEQPGSSGGTRSAVAERPEPWQVSNPRGLLPREERFADRYAGFDLEGLQFAQREVLYRFQSKRSKALGERFDQGLYEVRGLNSVEDGVPGYRLKQVPGSPLTQVRQVPGSPDIVQIAWLPFEEYTEIYDLHEEWSWLCQKVWMLEHPQVSVK
jgi:hypothetical protein